MATGPNLRIAITFNPAMFARIEKLANQRGLSFSQQVRELCKKGLDHV
jgi:hypothetical protein